MMLGISDVNTADMTDAGIVGELNRTGNSVGAGSEGLERAFRQRSRGEGRGGRERAG